MGVGVGVGWMLSSDSDLSADGYLGGQLDFWMSEMMSFRIAWGSATLEDESALTPGKMKVTPVTAWAMLSLPTSADAVLSPFRWSIGLGGGYNFFDHTNGDVEHGLPVLAFQGGIELLLGGGAGRTFFVADVLSGDLVDISGVERDLTRTYLLLAGLEISF
jgi:hypothetical protein